MHQVVREQQFFSLILIGSKIENVQLVSYSNFAAPNYAATYNEPNKFVDQGYNNVHHWDVSRQEQLQQQLQQQQQQQQHQSRVIPIQLETGHPYLNGPPSQSPHVIQR